ncbi:MAG: DUF2062 domain-containing protein [Planctomycetaceae bacterium]
MPASRIKSWLNPQTLLRNILGINDSAHAIALGTAIGTGIGMSPTVGIQMIIVMLVAMITRPFFHFNRMAGVLAVYISNPVTAVPIYYFLYWVGTFFVEGKVAREDFEKILEYDSFEGWWNAITGLFVDIGTPLLIGTAIVAPISGLIAYPVMRVLLYWFRGKHQTEPTDESGSEEPTNEAEPNQQ